MYSAYTAFRYIEHLLIILNIKRLLFPCVIFLWTSADGTIVMCELCINIVNICFCLLIIYGSKRLEETLIPSTRKSHSRFSICRYGFQSVSRFNVQSTNFRCRKNVFAQDGVRFVRFENHCASLCSRRPTFIRVKRFALAQGHFNRFLIVDK